MPYYKHYSFDLWLTLIKSNPSFKQERTRFFYDNFNYNKKTPEEVGLIFRQVDIMCNHINEKTGKNIDAEEMYLMVITMMNDYTFPMQDIDLNALYKEMDYLVFKHMPVVYCAETPKVLRHLRQLDNTSISILSNTGFIKGETLRTVLKHIELERFFDFQIYSDEVGMSKPSQKLFELMLRSVTKNRREIDLKEIIHIGDNPKADIEGAESVGIHSLLINSNTKFISNLIC